MAQSFFSQCLIWDPLISNDLKPTTVPINKPLVLSAKSANLKCKTHMAEKKSQKKNLTLRDKQVLTSEIKDINSKIDDIKKSYEMLDKLFVDCIMQAEKENDMHLVTKGNSFKWACNKKKEDIKNLVKTLNILTEKLYFFT